MNGLSEALSAAGLLLAALALIYSTWTPAIDAAISLPMGTTPNEVNRSKGEVRAVRNGRALPIAIASWVILAIFLVRDWDILTSPWRCADETHCEFSDIAAVFLLTQVLVLGLAIHSVSQVRNLNAKL